MKKLFRKTLVPSPQSLFPYIRTLRNYLRTPKARHDLRDYARAGLLILFTTAIIMFLIGKVGN